MISINFEAMGTLSHTLMALEGLGCSSRECKASKYIDSVLLDFELSSIFREFDEDDLDMRMGEPSVGSNDMLLAM